MANPPRPPTPGRPEKGGRPSVERAEALRDVMAHAVEVEKVTRRSSGPPGDSGARRVVALAFAMLLLGFTIYTYLARPEFIWGPNVTAVSDVRRDANLRFTMFLLARRIEAYRAASHAYPADLLAVTSAPPAGVTYVRVSDNVFELKATEGNREVTFRSDEPTDRFLGQTPSVVAGRGR